MRKVIIATDSTCDLSKELVEKYDIKVLPLHVNFESEVDKDYLDGVDINGEMVYQKVKEINKGVPPHTSAASVGELMIFFKQFIDQDYDVLYCGIGSLLSSNNNNASIASEEFEEGRVRIVESNTLSSATGLVLLKMCKYRDQGLSSLEIYEQVKDVHKGLSAKFCIDTLSYLYKGGRCSGMEMVIAHTLHIHPIAKVINGKLIVYKKVMGPYLKAVDFQIEEFKRDLPNIDKDALFITHSGRIEGIDQYIFDKIKEFYPVENIHITQAGCVISSHCGPKTIGILYNLNK